MKDEEPSEILQKREDIKSTEENEMERAELVLGLLPSNTFDKALDLGCGLGTCIRLLKSKGFVKEIIGLDIYPIGKELNPDLDIRKFDLNNLPLPFENAEFDLVIATETLMHTFYPHFILKEIKRVLKDDGYAVVSMHNALHLVNRKDVVLGRSISEHGLDSHAVHYFTNIKQNRRFVQSEFEITNEVNLWFTKGKTGLLAKIIRYPNLFSRCTIFLCKKHE